MKPYPLCLGNIWKDFTINNLKKTGEKRLKRAVVLSVDYSAIDTNDILDICRYLKERYIK